MAKQDLFTKYYKSDKSKYIKAPVVCSSNGDYDNMHFTINDDGANVSNGAETLAEVLLSDLKVPLDSYAKNTILLQPKEYRALLGDYYGEGYKRRFFEINYKDLDLIPEWEKYTMPSFNIKYRLQNGKLCEELVTLKITDESFIDNINEWFKEKNIKICAKLEYKKDLAVTKNDKLQSELKEEEECCGNVCIDPRLEEEDNTMGVLFTSTVKGYDFFINLVGLTLIEMSEDEPDSPFETETYIRLKKNWRYDVDPLKYPNGAFKGIVLKPEYPMYNNEIEEVNKTVWFAHIQNNIRIFNKINNDITLIDKNEEKIKIKIDSNDRLYTDSIVNVDAYGRGSQYWDDSYYKPITKDWGKEISSLFKFSGKFYFLFEELYKRLNWNRDISKETDLLNLGEELVKYILDDVSDQKAKGEADIDIEKLIYNIVNNESERLNILEENQLKIANYLQHVYKQLSMNGDDVEIDPDEPENPEEPEEEIKDYKIDNILETEHGMISLSDYLIYLEDNNLWSVIGDLYIQLGREDTDNILCKNMINSLVLYNPHDYPIKITYLTFI